MDPGLRRGERSFMCSVSDLSQSGPPKTAHPGAGRDPWLRSEPDYPAAPAPTCVVQRQFVLQHTRGGGPRLPILMLSANEGVEHRDAGRLAGADGHFAKPITLTGLIRPLPAA